MRAVIQRVNTASVAVENKVVATINRGLLIFLGVLKGDTSVQAKQLAAKTKQLRIFNDHKGKMNLCATEVEAEILVVSEFTLCADLADSGRRPSFDRAQGPELAQKLYLEFIDYLQEPRLKIKQGVFKEHMTVHIENDGPVTFILESKDR